MKSQYNLDLWLDAQLSSMLGQKSETEKPKTNAQDKYSEMKATNSFHIRVSLGKNHPVQNYVQNW
jgi:hypothetical protein